MPVFLFISSLVLIVSAIKGKQKDLFALLKDDFTGDRNFTVFVFSIGLLCAIGSVDRLKPVSNAFLALLLLAIVLANGRKNLFGNMLDQIKEGTA